MKTIGSLFHTQMYCRISQISPLAQRLLTNGPSPRNLPPHISNPLEADDLPWRTVQKPNERNKQIAIQKLGDYGDDPKITNVPLWRVRTTVTGRSVLAKMPSLVMDYDVRERWDDAIGSVGEVIPLNLKEANDVYGKRTTGGKYDGGKTTRCGIGHCVTKPAVGGLISAREQMTVCGVQEWGTGNIDGTEEEGALVWGFECEDGLHGNLWPENTERETRAKSGIFTIAMLKLPESDNVEPHTYAVEYTLQLAVGGSFPPFAMGAVNAVVINAVKTMFKYAKKEYFIEGGPADISCQQEMSHSHIAAEEAAVSEAAVSK